MDGYEVVGWVGAVLVLAAYWLVTKRGTSLLYHLMNLVGAAGLLVNALHHGAFPSTSVNAIWLLIALWGIRIASAPRRPAATRGGHRG
jgi:hypothetical protein